MKSILLALLATTAITGVASAKGYWLAAVRTCVTPAGAAAGSCIVGANPSPTDPVPVWSFVQISQAEYSAKATQPSSLAAATVPGPLLTVESSDTAGLTLHLLNTLPVPVSLIIPSLPGPMAPTWVQADGTTTFTGTRPANDVTSRMRSLAAETAPGGTHDYTWSSLIPGSFVYESGTHQAIQVQMGLHGGLIVASGPTTVGAATGSAYPNVSFAQQVATYLVEIDTAMHRTVDASPTHDATPSGSASPVSPLEYWPNVFYTSQTTLSPDFSVMPAVNGHNQILVGQPTLIRFFNSTLRSHVQVVQDEALGVVAEDALPYPYVRNQYSVQLEAGKTKDALLLPAAVETVAVYDRMLSTGNVGNKQGLLAFLDVQSPSTPTAYNDSYGNIPMGQAYSVAAKGVLTNDVSHDGQPLQATLITQAANGTVALNADGSFTYTPKAGSTAMTDAFAYKATETVNGTTFPSNQATVQLAFVATKPIAGSDSFYVTGRTGSGQASTTIAAPGVLANDTPSTGVTLAVVTGTGKGPSHGSVSMAQNGSFTFTPTVNYTGPDSFQYTISKGGVISDPAMVSITILPRPAAVADTATVAHGGTISALNVLANDTGAAGATGITITAQPTRGTVTINPDLTVKYVNTSARAGQNDSFRYTFTNANGVASTGGAAVVSITVQ